jgi:hypothetical protein
MDRLLHGTDPRGEKSALAKLSNSDVEAILKSRESHTKLAVRYGVSLSNIESIRSGRSWAWMGRDKTPTAEKGYVRGDNHPSSKLTEQDVLEIVRRRSVRTRAQLAEEYGTTLSSIDDILYGRSWAWLTGAKKRR